MQQTTDTEEPIYEVVQLEAFKLVGIGGRTSNRSEMSGHGIIVGLWDRYWSEDVQSAMADPTQEGDPRTYGCYTEYENGVEGLYTLLIGRKAQAYGVVPSGQVEIAVPASRYAVFTTRRGPVGTVVLEMWQRIWRWAATSGLERTYTGDFELYDERSADPDNAVVAIYIAIGGSD